MPQVRAVRTRLARVAYTYPREAPGRTCQHRSPQATRRTPTPRRHQPSTRAGRRQTRPPGASWDPGPARMPGGTTAGHLPPAREGRTVTANPSMCESAVGPGSTYQSATGSRRRRRSLPCGARGTTATGSEQRLSEVFAKLQVRMLSYMWEGYPTAHGQRVRHMRDGRSGGGCEHGQNCPSTPFHLARRSVTTVAW